MIEHLALGHAFLHVAMVFEMAEDCWLDEVEGVLVEQGGCWESYFDGKV